MYVYIPSEPGVFTVGFYDPTGKFQPESDHADRGTAGDRVAYLNGSAGRPPELGDMWGTG